MINVYSWYYRGYKKVENTGSVISIGRVEGG